MRASDEAVDIQSRMFAPLYGIPEDPATGSANVALIGLLAHLAPERSLTLSKQIGQGFDMGRPSIMSAQAVKRDGDVAHTLIGGECVEVMRVLLLPFSDSGQYVPCLAGFSASLLRLGKGRGSRSVEAFDANLHFFYATGKISAVGQRNALPSTHIRCIITASLCHPDRGLLHPAPFSETLAHALSADHFPVRVSKVVAASKRYARTGLSPHREMPTVVPFAGLVTPWRQCEIRPNVP